MPVKLINLKEYKFYYNFADAQFKALAAQIKVIDPPVVVSWDPKITTPWLRLET